MAALAMQGAGMGANFVAGQLQGWASLIDKWAMADAYKAELARQAGYQKQAQSAFDQQLQRGYGDVPGQLAGAAKTRTANYGQTMATPLGFNLPYQRSASGARDIAANQMSAAQRANLQKYGDWMFNQKMANIDTGRRLDQISNFAGGTAQVFPYRMYDAQHAGDILAEVGAAIGSISAGAQGVKSAFGNTPPTVPIGNGLRGYPQSNYTMPGYMTDLNYGGYLPSGQAIPAGMPDMFNPNIAYG